MSMSIAHWAIIMSWYLKSDTGEHLHFFLYLYPQLSLNLGRETQMYVALVE